MGRLSAAMVLTAAGLALASCATDGSTARLTVEKCARAAGISGTYAVDYEAQGKTQSFTILPTSGVLPEQVDAANACIARAGLGGSSSGGAMTRADYVPEIDGGYTAAGGSCGTSVMIGGSGYCIKADR